MSNPQANPSGQPCPAFTAHFTAHFFLVQVWEPKFVLNLTELSGVLVCIHSFFDNIISSDI